MQIKVAPTRMELLRLKKRIELAHRGHRLLQDKLEGLIKEFLPLIDEYVAAREELDRRYPRALAFTARAAAEVGEDRLGPALAQTGLRVEVEVSEQRRSGVAVPVMEAAIDRSRPFYSLLATPELPPLPQALGAVYIGEDLRLVVIDEVLYKPGSLIRGNDPSRCWQVESVEENRVTLRFGSEVRTLLMVHGTPTSLPAGRLVRAEGGGP